jgi:DNA-binding transcriptional MerR regulator
MQAEHMNITQVAALYGVTLRTLRFYEDRGLLQPIRTNTARFYTPKDRIRIELILKGKRLGFTLSEIEKLILAPSSSPPVTEFDTGSITTRLDSGRIAEQIEFLERKRDEIVAALDDLRSALEKKDRMEQPEATSRACQR